MSGTFTHDDIEKTVENANGEVIGTVTAVEGDTARVKPRAGIMDSIKATLGWNRGRDKTVVIHEDAIGERSSGTIRLEAESIEPLEPGSEREAEPTESTATDPAGDDAEPGGEPEIHDRERDPGREKRERAGGIEESAAEPPNAGSNSHPAAKRDPGSELTEEMSEVAKRDTTGVTDEPLDSQREREPAAERNDAFEETDATDTSGERETDDTSGERETDDTSGERETDGTDEETSTEPTDDAIPDGTANGKGRTAVDDRRDGPEETAETDTQTEETDTQTEPGAVSEARSMESSDSIEGIEERDLGGDSSAASQEPSRERSGEQDPSRGSSEETAADTNPADELDPGVDIESAIDTPDAEEDRTATEDDDDADEIEFGVDIDPAADPSDTGGDSSDAETPNPADELDRGGDIDAAAKTDAGSNSETDSRSETESDAETGEETTAEEERSDVEFDPGIDIESAVESDRRSEPVIDPDTVAGGRTDAETGAEATAREIVPEGTEVTERMDRSTSEAAADRPAVESDRADRSRERRRSSSPLAAMVDVQRAAMIQGQETFQRSLAAQQRAARGVVEAPLLVQRQSLEAARAATRRYFDAVSAVTGTGINASRERRTSLDEAVTELEDAHSRLEDEDLEEFLTGHLEEIRALQARLDAQDEAGTELVATLLERQLTLLEECQQRLDG